MRVPSPDVLPAVATPRAVDQALASVRAEGLEPSTLVERLFARCIAGELSYDRAVELLRRHYQM